VGHAIPFLIRHGYPLLFFWILAEQGALPLPSIPLLLACGALARDGKLNVALVLLSGMAACLLADNVWFQLGRRRGGKILKLVCRLSLEPDSCVRQTENAFLKYGMRSLLVSKFIPGLNAVAAPMAGSSGASLARFALYDSCGALLWIASYTFLGYLFSDQLEIVATHAMRLGSGLLLVVVGLLTAWIVWKFVQRRRFLRKLSVARITAEELRDMLSGGESPMILDLRNRVDNEEFSLPGALRITVAELEERHHEIPRDRDIVLFCS
jgi:membrane protein DedA with SNARE-associated domain